MSGSMASTSGASRAGHGIPAGHDRNARRWAQGAHRAIRRVPRVHQVLADLLRSCKRRGMSPRFWPSGRALGFGPRCARCSPTPANSAAGFTSRPTCSTPYPSRRSPAPRSPWPRSIMPRTASTFSPRQGVRRLLRLHMAQSGRQDHRQPRRVAGALPPRRALGASTHDQSHQVDLRHGRLRQRVTHGPRLTGRGCGDGVQAHRVRPATLARGRCRAVRTRQPRTVHCCLLAAGGVRTGHSARSTTHLRDGLRNSGKEPGLGRSGRAVRAFRASRRRRVRREVRRPGLRHCGWLASHSCTGIVCAAAYPVGNMTSPRVVR